MSVVNFMRRVAPELCKHFLHIIPERYLTQDVEGAADLIDEEHKECLRHDIESRVRAATMADKLYECDCLDLVDYEYDLNTCLCFLDFLSLSVCCYPS